MQAAASPTSPGQRTRRARRTAEEILGHGQETKPDTLSRSKTPSPRPRRRRSIILAESRVPVMPPLGGRWSDVPLVSGDANRGLWLDDIIGSIDESRAAAHVELEALVKAQSPSRTRQTRRKSLPASPGSRRRRYSSEEQEVTAIPTSIPTGIPSNSFARRDDRPPLPALPRHRLALPAGPPVATSDASWMHTLEVLSQRQSWNHTLTSIAQRHKLISSKQGARTHERGQQGVAPGTNLSPNSDWRPSISFVQPLPRISV